MVNPCPCMLLQKGTIVLAVIDVIFGLLSLVLFILALIGVAAVGADSDSKIEESTRTQLIIISAVAIVVIACQIALAAYLWRSAKLKSYRGCKIWLIVSVILLVIDIISTGISISAGSSSVNIVATVLGLLYRLYVMFVVYSFMKELSSNGNPNV